MKLKKGKLILLLVLILFSINLVLSEGVSTPSVCCEKTKSGAFCINTNESNCDLGINPITKEKYKSSPTSCETTSYCRPGTCYDSDEGICMENTPEQICSGNGGTWDEREVEEVPQCQLGCCVIADQAAFVSLVRCKKLSTLYGVETDYRTNINSEIECIATAQSQDMGACVYEKDFERVCKFTTRSDCGASNQVEDLNSTNLTSSEKRFYKDLLCSAEELNTVNAKQVRTACYQGEVYWFDSEGQRENVYSSDSEKSWNNGRVTSPNDICSPNGNANKNCGNCEYLFGTRCAPNDAVLGKPEYFCKKTECTDRNGNKRLNGESWCVGDGISGNGLDTVGSRYYREICVDGSVRVEPCEDFRNEICISGSIETEEGEFATSACRVNRWQDCTIQTDEDDCKNSDKRDCIWFESLEGMLLGSSATVSSTSSFTNPTASGGKAFTNPTASPNVVTSVDEESGEAERLEGVCVPNFPPGLKFWETGSAQTICNQASAKCIVTYKKGVLDGGWIAEKNKECLTDEWALKANRICTSLGDCGGYINYQGVYTDDGYEWRLDKERKEFSPNTVNKIKGGFTGLLIEKITE